MQNNPEKLFVKIPQGSDVDSAISDFMQKRFTPKVAKKGIFQTLFGKTEG